MLDVGPAAIRYWCNHFSCLRPKRNNRGVRIFSKYDVERLKRIYHLLRERKMTIEGAKQAMRRRVIDAEDKNSDVALLEQLQSLRAMLVEVRESIGEESPVDVVAVAQSAAKESSEPDSKKKRAPRRKLIGEEGVVERPLFPFYEQTLF